MPSFFKALANTVTSLGDAAMAPGGLVLDLASAPFDDKDDDFGSLLSKAADKGSDILSPLSGDTLPGMLFGKTMHGLDVAYREGVSEPLSTALTMGAVTHDHPLELFDKEAWAQSYQIAQHRSIGQAYTVGLDQALGEAYGTALPFGNYTTQNPLDPKAYDNIHAEQGFTATALSGTTDAIARWYLDPGIVAGKAAGAYRAATYLGRLKNTDRLGLLDNMYESQRKTFGIPAFLHKATDPKTRTDSFLDFINGSNHTGRALQGEEIYLASPELRRSAEGRSIANLLSQAGEYGPNAQRRVLAVAAGDVTQIDRLRNETADAASIADALENLQKGATLDLVSEGLNNSARFSPERIADFERQITNLNTRGEVNQFAETWAKQLDDQIQTNAHMLDTAGTLDFLPRAHKAGETALKRSSGERFIDKTSAAHHAVLDRAQEFARDESVTGVFQKGLHQVPLLLVKTAGLPASPYTRAPKAISDALRQTHYVGVANLHDWNGSITQLDSMMRVAGVDNAARIQHLSIAGAARSEMDKQTAIQRVETLAMHTLGEKFGIKDRAFIEELMSAGHQRRSAGLAQLRGRAYAATTNAAQKGSKSALSDLTNRVDMIDDHGIPLAAPLLETQLANSIPLIDIHLAKKVLERNENHTRLKDLANAWSNEAIQLNGLKGLIKRGEVGALGRYEKLITAKEQSMDYMMMAAQDLTRLWKFSVLFRLGYPMRVVMDDHMRIGTQLNAASFYLDNGSEAGKNWWLNNAPAFINSNSRKAEAARAYRNAQAQHATLKHEYFDMDAHSADDLASIKDAVKTLRRKKATRSQQAEAQATIDLLDPTGGISAYYHRVKDIQKAQARSAGLRRHATAEDGDSFLRLESADAADARVQYLLEQQGRDPEVIRKELEDLTAKLVAGPKAFREDKRFLGSEPLSISGPDGANVLIPGAFGGESGDVYRGIASSHGTFQAQMHDSEEGLFRVSQQGSWRTIAPTEAEHMSAWADTLNHQFRNSQVAMHFVRGGTVDEFAEKLASDPAWQHLKERLPHFAHDPEDWGHRVQAMVRDYLPTPEMREHLAKGHINARTLAKMMPDQSARPVIHGQAAAVQFGTATSMRVMGAGMNRIYKFLGEAPTDRLSRHPFFNSLYKAEVKRQAELVAMTRRAEGRMEFSPDDLKLIERQSRKVALNHLKQTLFDMSAHSHAAHVLRFVSPFFAAHQESLGRWWRIAQDKPYIIRRFQQAFDAPRNAGLVYDVETGEPVKPGEGISTRHRILLRVPGAEDSTVNQWLKKVGGGKHWSVGENSFNLILQNGLMNPGAGPVVTVPAEYFANKYADMPNINKMARILSPVQPDSPLDAVTPAWAQRFYAFVKGPGSREWDSRYSVNISEAAVQFQQDNGRAPTKAEFETLLQKAGDTTNRDLLFMFVGNAVSPAPWKPESKYAAVQHGLSQIRAKAKTDGKDWEWVKDQFTEKYGDIYSALLYSTSNNIGKLDGTPAEVAALKRYRGLTNRIDPRLTRMVIGPTAAMMADSDKTMGMYSAQARQWMKNTVVQPGSTETYVSDKEPRQAYMGLLVSQGWDKYTELTNALTVEATRRGLKSYDEAPDLVAAKRLGVDQIKQENFAFAADYDSFDKGKFNTYLEDIRQIAGAKVLTGDTERQDVYWLNQYLQVRDAISASLAQRKAAGLSFSETAQANAPLMAAFRTAVNYIREQSTYFDDYDYHGVLEFDPYLTAAGGN